MTGKYVPIDPLAISSTTPSPVTLITGEPVMSALRGSNFELIREAMRLWSGPGDVVMDVTYGRGAFWNDPPIEVDGVLQVPQIRHDLLIDGVDCRHLPEDDASVDVHVFDPPYRALHGGEGGVYNRSYRLDESGLDSINDVMNLYSAGLAEAFRVLKPGGRVLVKCQDTSYSSRLHLVHLDVIRLMERAGFEFSDMFVLVNNARSVHNGRARATDEEATVISQKRARRNHSYLLVGTRPIPRPVPAPLRRLLDRFDWTTVAGWMEQQRPPYFEGGEQPG